MGVFGPTKLNLEDFVKYKEEQKLELEKRDKKIVEVGEALTKSVEDRKAEIRELEAELIKRIEKLEKRVAIGFEKEVIIVLYVLEFMRHLKFGTINSN